MMAGMPERHTHDYVRHGITALFAALDVASGEQLPWRSAAFLTDAGHDVVHTRDLRGSNPFGRTAENLALTSTNRQG